MKIVLVTCGSRGDVQPMLALSLALQARGHNVLLCGPPEKVAWAHEMGCPFYPLGASYPPIQPRTETNLAIAINGTQIG